MALIKSGKYVARRVVLIGKFRLTNLWTCIIVQAVNVDTAINRFENCKSLRPGFYVLWHLGNSKLTHNMNARRRSRFYSHRRRHPQYVPQPFLGKGGRAVNWTVLFKQNIAYVYIYNTRDIIYKYKRTWRGISSVMIIITISIVYLLSVRAQTQIGAFL